MGWFSNIREQFFPQSANSVGEEAQELTDTVVADEKLLKNPSPFGFHALFQKDTNASSPNVTPFASRILQKAKQQLLRQDSGEEEAEGENTGFISPANLFKTSSSAPGANLKGFDSTLQQSKNASNAFVNASKKLPKTR